MSKNIIAELGTRLGRDKKSTQILIDAMRQALIQACSRQTQVAIPGFGTFTPEKHDEQIVTDLSTGQRVLLPPEIILTFNAANKLRKIAQSR